MHYYRFALEFSSLPPSPDGSTALVIALLAVARSPARLRYRADELASHCNRLEAEPDGADAQYCIRYIQGLSTAR